LVRARIQDLPHSSRPRERLRDLGVGSLSQVELLAIVIQQGSQGLNALELAQGLLAEFGDIVGLRNATLAELQQVKGIGFATACKLQAALCLSVIADSYKQGRRRKISTAEQVFKLLKGQLRDKKQEFFKLLSLDVRGGLIKIDNVYIGTLDESFAHPREIYRVAIKNLAKQIIMVHNHPSGDVRPSEADIAATEALQLAGKMLDIMLIDHVILSNEKYFSFRNNNLL